MTYVLAHIDDAVVKTYDWRATDPLLDVSILLPGASKVCTVVPLGGLRHFLPVLHDLIAEGEPLRCEQCGEAMSVPIVERPHGALDLGYAPFELGAAIARDLAGAEEPE